MTTLPNIGKPAANALSSIGITTLEQVSTLDKTALSKIHGVGPKAIAILEKALAEQQLTFQSNQSNTLLPKTDFAIICPFKCDNAPKRRIIRDYLIASASANQSALETLISDSLEWIVSGDCQTIDKATFLTLICENRQDISSLEIHSILTHRKEGSAHGTITTKKGDKIYFSDIFRFTTNPKDPKINQITSFIINKKMVET
ncbi:helix-hairpin-helix domain-containing protein [Enterococcus sp. 5H]|uniref:helix-hairpin-helix domain-containing protein n=1 Tax=Enterococcus sp. 5H TaxID=1229490 RepID=UPI0023037E69|nr:helix-hairpin-helix domain-containing protein [Enterococcus sp. 5H]MDA9472466.1 hypothetical protein [Enterococcus sp. 5H]